MLKAVSKSVFCRVFFALLFLIISQHVSQAEMDFYVFRDYDSAMNHFLKCEKLGDHDSISARKDLNNPSPEGGSALEVIYDPRGYETHYFSTISWVIDEKEAVPRYDITGAKRLVLYARGKNGGEIVEFTVGSISLDSDRLSAASSGPVLLSNKWREYSIDLEGLNLSNIKTGFSMTVNRYDNSEGAVIYLDDIKYDFWD
jgi:hypothetical protein